MPTTTDRRELDLAHAKAYRGIPITLEHRKLLAVELAERAYLFGTECLDLADWQVLREHIAHPACPNLELRFTDLVAAFGEHADCLEDPQGWAHRNGMSAKGVTDVTHNRLTEAVESLLSVRHG